MKMSLLRRTSGPLLTLVFVIGSYENLIGGPYRAEEEFVSDFVSGRHLLETF